MSSLGQLMSWGRTVIEKVRFEVHRQGRVISDGIRNKHDLQQQLACPSMRLGARGTEGIDKRRLMSGLCSASSRNMLMALAVLQISPSSTDPVLRAIGRGECPCSTKMGP